MIGVQWQQPPAAAVTGLPAEPPGGSWHRVDGCVAVRHLADGWVVIALFVDGEWRTRGVSPMAAAVIAREIARHD